MNNEDYRPKGKEYLLVNDDSELRIDAEYLDQLKAKRSSMAENKCTLCLHNDVRAGMHEMINAYAKGEYVRPHYHPDKTETKIMIEGRMLILLFEENGNIRDKIVLSDDRKGCFLIRIDKGIIHSSIPLSDVVFYEATTGPYVGKGDSIFPVWSPETDRKEEIFRLYAKLELDKFLEKNGKKICYE